LDSILGQVLLKLECLFGMTVVNILFAVSRWTLKQWAVMRCLWTAQKFCRTQAPPPYNLPHYYDKKSRYI